LLVGDDCFPGLAAQVQAMSTFQARRPAGIPVGGQFAPQQHPEPGYNLEVDAEPGQDSPVLPPGPLGATGVGGGRIEIASATPTDRFVGRCTDCNRPVAVDDPSGGSHRRRVRCPQCDRPVTLDRVVGVVTTMECNTSCELAVGAVCECSCGGVNHSGRYVGTGYETAEAVEAYREANTKRKVAAAKAAATRRRRKEEDRQAALEAFRAAHTTQVGWLEARAAEADATKSYDSHARDVWMARDMLGYLNRTGRLTYRQLELVDIKIAKRNERLAAEAAAAAAPPVPPAPQGTVAVTGRIITLHSEPSRFSYYGVEHKMLVESDDRWRVWATRPAALEDAQVGSRVTFTAELSRSERDETFAFGARPRKAALLTDEPVDASV